MSNLSIFRRLDRSYVHMWAPTQRFASTQRAVTAVIGLNLVVFGAWYYSIETSDSKLQKWLSNNATLSWANVNAKRYWTLITSAFSHQNFFHFLFNMMSLNAFSGVMITAAGLGLGAPHIMALTLGSAITGSLAFLYQRRKDAQQHDRRWGPYAMHAPTAFAQGLGASGVVMGFAAAATGLSPFARMMIIPIPIGIPMWALTGAYVAIDYYLLSSNDKIGHDAHLGGAIFGAAYYLAFLRGYGGISHLLRRRY